MSDKLAAVKDLIWESKRPNNTKTGYMQILRACRKLEFTAEETREVARAIEYDPTWWDERLKKP